MFAKRKLTVVALNRLISQVPKLAFLKPMAIMGHGGLPALSLSVKVSLPLHMLCMGCAECHVTC